jgi:hypothetical protein
LRPEPVYLLKEGGGTSLREPLMVTDSIEGLENPDDESDPIKRVTFDRLRHRLIFYLSTFTQEERT